MSAQDAVAIFNKRFGKVGNALFDALPFFSRDVVGLTASYLVCPIATQNAKPKFLFEFGASGEKEGQFTNYCLSLAVSPDNRLWIGDTRCLQIFDMDGKFIQYATAVEPQNDRWITGVAFDTETNEAFVADYRKDRVLVCDLQGSLLRSFEAVLHSPWDVAVDSKSGIVYVVDSSNNRIAVFNRQGSFLREVKSAGSEGSFNSPHGMAYDAASKELWVADQRNSRVLV